MIGIVRRQLLLSACGLLGLHARVRAQPATRVYRIGLLSIGTDPGHVDRWQVPATDKV